MLSSQAWENVAGLSLNDLTDVATSHFVHSWSDIKSKPLEKSNKIYGARSKKEKDSCGITRTFSAPLSSENDCRESFLSESDFGCASRRMDLKVLTWNIAAPNNNPFEFWVSHSSDEYNDLMLTIQKFINNPEKLETKIENIFTDDMYQELRDELALQGTVELDCKVLDHIWTSDLMGRMAISEFLKDRSFGEKRLISMPDRIRSSIATQSGLIFRPSPITGNQEEMNDVQTWWNIWKSYMFKTEINVEGKSINSVFSLFETIPQAKYPAITEAEQKISIALQTLCLAIFDSIFIHILSSLAPNTWQPLKNSLHKALFERKAALCVSILQEQYGDADVVFIQEASEAFASRAGVCLDHFVLRPSGVDGRRSQLSLILARKSLFLRHTARDVTEEVLRRLPAKCTTAGDLCVFEVASHEGPFLLASFHGDSDGTCTAPVLTALEALAQECFPEHTLLFGLDANTAAGPACPVSNRLDPPIVSRDAAASAAKGAATSKSSASRPGLDGGGFTALLDERGLGSCWQGQDLRGLWTTFNARTYLQPQLHKAVGLDGVLDQRHMRLRDWVVFRAGQLTVSGVERDNTGRGRFERRVMPSPAFPSDHAVVAATLRRLALPLPSCTAMRRGSAST
jgi:hypothetical protein